MLFKFGFFGRSNFASFLNERKLVGSALEIGTHRGDFAKEFLDSWHGNRLYCLDPWANLPGYEEQAKHLWGGTTREGDKEETLCQLHNHLRAGRCQLIQETSPEFLRRFRKSSLDFIFVDGDHSESAVATDLFEGWQLLKPGGIIAGHDIVMPGEPVPLWDVGIQKAAIAFCEEMKVDLYFVPELACSPWSFFIE